MLNIRPATNWDAHTLASRLRRADLEEIKASTGATPVGALLHGIESSVLCRVAVDSDDVPVAIFGVGEFNTVWMMAGLDIKRHRWEFLRRSRVVVDWLFEKYGKLHNLVDSRNILHHRWIKWCCFTIHSNSWCVLNDPKVPFYYFERSK